MGNHLNRPWVVYAWLFLGSALWLVRCLLDLGLARRPLLEPNLNAPGLLCLSVGVLGLLLAETVTLPVEEGAARNPAEPTGREDRPPVAPGNDNPVVRKWARMLPVPTSLKRELPQVIVSRVLASLAHIGLVVGLLAIGWRHFERPLTGMAMAACYLLLPYTRVAVVDSGQLISAALIVGAVFWHQRPAVAGVLIGLAAGWIPACLGLIALWSGFFRGRGMLRFILVALGAVCGCAMLGYWMPGLAEWARALGARSIAEVGLLPRFEPRFDGEFLERNRLEFSSAGLDCLSVARDRHHDLAGEKELCRVDCPVSRLARGQSVLVSRQGRHAGNALPPSGDHDDVSSHPRNSQASGANAETTPESLYAEPFILNRTLPNSPVARIRGLEW